ncbi:hypothetical protein [Methylomonas sp. AM2-LC]|uniref:hypothetical protein n=1 Tax=Methylomonas sp. AM2-LC TaxID=3153301 RepID=UPI003267B1AD
MHEQGKDHFLGYSLLAAVAFVSIIVAVWLNEHEKFAPIKAQINEENRMMNIRVINERGD